MSDLAASASGQLTDGVLDALHGVVGDAGLITDEAATRVYECDGFVLARKAPRAVVLPGSRDEVASVVRVLAEAGVAFVPRGAGTGLSGGCLPLQAPVMVGTSRLRRIRQIDLANERVVVEAGVVNLHVSRAVQPDGWLYAPDPSSQGACTIGGNVAENSGGPHTLKYGVTTNHVLGVEMVLADGQIVELGGAVEDLPGYDLRGLAIGAEGTFGIVTAATLRLVRAPQAVRTLMGRVRFGGGGKPGRIGDHRRRHRAGRAGVDGPTDRASGGGCLRVRISRGRRSRADRRARRAGQWGCGGSRGRAAVVH